MHEFGKDFYGSTLRVIIAGFIRGMTDFSSLGAFDWNFERPVGFFRTQKVSFADNWYTVLLLMHL